MSGPPHAQIVAAIPTAAAAMARAKSAGIRLAADACRGAGEGAVVTPGFAPLFMARSFELESARPENGRPR
jgi:hypothetical protein